MKIGMLFTGAETLEAIVQTGRAAEAAGFDSLWMVEAYRSAWVPLTALAAATSRVTLGPWVLNAYARSPFLTGLTALDFNALSNGRLELGLGGGNRQINEEWQGIGHTAVLSKIADQTRILRLMREAAAGSLVEYTGKIHRIRWRAVHPPRPFPIFLAAIFPAMLKVAARIADGIAGGATLSTEFLRDRLQREASQHAEAAGVPRTRCAGRRCSSLQCMTMSRLLATPLGQRSRVCSIRCRIPITPGPCASRALEQW